MIYYGKLFPKGGEVAMAYKLIIRHADVPTDELEEKVYDLLRSLTECHVDAIGLLLADRFVFASKDEIQPVLDILVKQNKIEKDTKSNQIYYFSKTVSRHSSSSYH